MEITRYIENRLKEIAKYYSEPKDPCSLELALHICINKELERIKNDNINKTKT